MQRTVTKKPSETGDIYKNKKKQSSIHDIYTHLDGIHLPKKSKKQQTQPSATMKESEPNQEKQSSDQEFIYQCPYCKELITFDQPIDADSNIECPHCGYHYIHPFHETDKEIKTQTKTTEKKTKILPHIPRPHIRFHRPSKEEKTTKTEKTSTKPFFSTQPSSKTKPSTTMGSKIKSIIPKRKKKTLIKSYIPPIKEDKKTKKTPLPKRIKHLLRSYYITFPDPKTLPNTIKKTIINNPIESLIIIIGLLFFIVPTLESIKIAITLVLIGSILLLFPTTTTKTLTKKTPPPPHQTRINAIKTQLIDIKNRLSIQETISILLIIWILFLFMITTTQQLDIYFILIFIGFLLTKELASNILPQKTQSHLTIYILIFLIAYIYLIIQKVLETMNTIS